MADNITEEQKRRYWGPERNAERRKRYQEDTAYREEVRQQVRDSYLRSRMAQGLDVRDGDCRENISLLPDIGTERLVVLTTGEQVDMLTFTTEEMSKALDRSQQVLYRWFGADLFPRPVALARIPSNNNQPVYTHDEVAALLEVFGQHQEESQYYRKYHIATRDKLFATAQRVRNSLRAQGVPMELVKKPKKVEKPKKAKKGKTDERLSKKPAKRSSPAKRGVDAGPHA